MQVGAAPSRRSAHNDSTPKHAAALRPWPQALCIPWTHSSQVAEKGVEAFMVHKLSHTRPDGKKVVHD
jgi:hypothetical protein